jgi:hypothetical protein
LEVTGVQTCALPIYKNINDQIGTFVDPYDWDNYNKQLGLVENIQDFSDLCVYRIANPKWNPKRKAERIRLYQDNTRFVSDQASGHNTALLAKIIAARHLVMANCKNNNPQDPRNYTAAQGEARVTREEQNLGDAAQPRQTSEQPSSSSARWKVYHNPSPAVDPEETRIPIRIQPQHRHEAWRDNEARRQANSPSEWSWDHQNWDWEQTPSAAQVYASQRTWDEPYPNIPRNPSRQFVDNAWDNYKKRKNDDRYKDDSRARKCARKG